MQISDPRHLVEMRTVFVTNLARRTILKRHPTRLSRASMSLCFRGSSHTQETPQRMPKQKGPEFREFVCSGEWPGSARFTRGRDVVKGSLKSGALGSRWPQVLLTSPVSKASYLSVNASSPRATEGGIFLLNKLLRVFVPSGTTEDRLRPMKCFTRPNGIRDQIEHCAYLNNNTTLPTLRLLHSWLHPPDAINVPSHRSRGQSNIPSHYKLAANVESLCSFST